MKARLYEILKQAQKLRASKIHLEPGVGGACVRFRIDGTLHDFCEMSSDDHSSMSMMVKELADIDLQNGGIFQQGIMKFNDTVLKGVFTVAIFPGLTGDRISIIPYQRNKVEFDLDKLGLDDYALSAIREAIDDQKPGIMMISGPTNSGKCTTIYAALLEMRKKNLTVATAEWEQRGVLPGVHQTIADDLTGMTFAAIGRAYLDADIDALFLRELRDFETAEVAFKAVLQRNKYVFTAMHCNSAIGTIERFRNMGVEDWVIAEGTSLIQGQRLLRRLCQQCKEEIEVNENPLLSAGMSMEQIPNARVFQPKGCQDCGNTGYRGTTIVAESLRMTDSFAQMMFTEGNRRRLIDFAIEEGMICRSSLG